MGEPKGPERQGLEKRFAGDLVKDLKDPILEASQERATKLIKRALTENPIEVLNELEQEVIEMRIADRFSKTKIVSHDSSHGMPRQQLANPSLQGQTEEGHKRQQLLLNLETVRNEIRRSIEKLEGVVMDIEMTKREG